MSTEYNMNYLIYSTLEDNLKFSHPQLVAKVYSTTVIPVSEI